MTLTLLESLGPLFLTVIVKVALKPGTMLLGPTLPICKSLEALTGAVTVLELFVASGSGVGVVMPAVFETGFGAL